MKEASGNVLSGLRRFQYTYVQGGFRDVSERFQGVSGAFLWVLMVSRSFRRFPREFHVVSETFKRIIKTIHVIIGYGGFPRSLEVVFGGLMMFSR